MTNPLPHYQKAINRIDDYFEYRHESEKDKAFVVAVLEELTRKLAEVKHERSNS